MIRSSPAWTPYWGRWEKYLADNTSHTNVKSFRELMHLAQTHRTHFTVFTAVERMRKR